MENRSFYNEILTEHNIHPEFKHDLPNADIVLEGVNPSCGDHIWLKLKTDGDKITDGAFVGDGCAISQASADIMLGMVIGQPKEKALQMADTFMRMIKGEASEAGGSTVWKKPRPCGIFPICPPGSSALCWAGAP